MSTQYLKALTTDLLKRGFRPRVITLRLRYPTKHSIVTFASDTGEITLTFDKPIGFTPFVKAIKSALEGAFGELILKYSTFREEWYDNQALEIHIFPTGSLGILEIFLRWRK